MGKLLSEPQTDVAGRKGYFMDLSIIVVDIIAVLMLAVIFIYLNLDKKRFRIEVQFRPVREALDAWMDAARERPECAAEAALYAKTRNVTKKYRALAAASEKARGHETARMRECAAELAAFAEVYNNMVGDFNRALERPATGRVARLIGFRPLPELHFVSEENQLYKEEKGT